MLNMAYIYKNMAKYWSTSCMGLTYMYYKDFSVTDNH